jgi:hypothetical protein
VPILNKLPRDQKLLLGNRMITELYNILDSLVMAQYTKKKLVYLEPLNAIQILRLQTGLLLHFKLMPEHRHEYAIKLINEIGQELDGWIKSQQGLKDRDRELILWL